MDKCLYKVDFVAKTIFFDIANCVIDSDFICSQISDYFCGLKGEAIGIVSATTT